MIQQLGLARFLPGQSGQLRSVSERMLLQEIISPGEARVAFQKRQMVTVTERCGVIQEIIPLEGLVLEEVDSGLYTLHCLPLKLVDSDGAPTRCILVQ